MTKQRHPGPIRRADTPPLVPALFLARQPAPPGYNPDDALAGPAKKPPTDPARQIGWLLSALATGGEPPSGIWVGTARPIPKEGRVALITTMRSPNGEINRTWREPFPVGPLEHFRGYSLDIYGIPGGGQTDAYPTPKWGVYEPSGSLEFTVSVYRERIRFESSNLVAESLTLPIDTVDGEWGQRTVISGWELPHTDDDVEKARHGLTLLGLLPEVEGSRRGKRAGDGATWPGGVEEFLQDLWATLEKRQKTTGRSWGHDPTSRDFRLAMHNTAAPRTVRDWLDKAGLRPQDIKSGAVTGANYPQFVAEKGRYHGR